MRMPLASPHHGIEGGPCWQIAWWMDRRIGTFGGAQLGGARARIGGNLIVLRRHRALGEDGEARRRQRGFRLMPRAAACLGALVEEILDDAIFQRMKRHHDEPATGLEHLFGGGKRQMQLVEFAVDENSQTLERPRRRMNIAGLRTYDLADEIGQRTRRGNRFLLARGNDGPRNAARMTFFAENI